jgi:type 1 glutamine amidotransferase
MIAAACVLELCGGFQAAGAADNAAVKPAEKIKVLIVTGGHGFQPGSFFKLFDNNPEISYNVVDEKKGAEAWDREDLRHYDVVLLYDFQREMTDAQKARFLALFDQGVGLVVLHHALLSYQNWPEYERIAGGKYLLDHETVDGKTIPASTYQGDVDINVKVVAKDHPVTAGLQDFTIHDEIYRGVRTTGNFKLLMTAEDKPLAWARTEKNSRVVTIIIGHGPAHDDANFQKLLAQSIRWVRRGAAAEDSKAAK